MLRETGVISWVKKTATGRDVNELDEFQHRLLLANTPSKKERLIDDVNDSIAKVDKHLVSTKDQIDATHLHTHRSELVSMLSKAKAIRFEYEPLDNNHQESAMREDMSSGLSAVPSGTLFIKNYASNPTGNTKVYEQPVTVARPVPVAGRPLEPELPLDSLSGKEIRTVRQAVDDNALDKMSDSYKQRMAAAADNSVRDSLRKEIRDKMLEAEALIRSARSFTNSERPKLVSNLHKFIDRMQSFWEALGASDPDKIKGMLEGRPLAEAQFGNRKYNMYKKEFTVEELHNAVGNMALSGGFDSQRVIWHNRLGRVTTAAEAESFCRDAQKAIDVLGTVSQEAAMVDGPNNNAQKANEAEKTEIREIIRGQIGYIESLIADARKRFPAGDR